MMLMPETYGTDRKLGNRFEKHNFSRSMDLEQANHNKPSGTGCCDYLSECQPSHQHRSIN
jgi:hypothetical protein